MQTHEPASEHDGGAASEPMLETFKGIWREIPGLISDRIELLSAELQRAGLALLHIVVLGMVLSVLGITLWVILWCLVVVGLAVLGLHWISALLIALFVQLVLVAWAVHRVKTLLPLLRLPATRRRLMFTSREAAAKAAAPPPNAPPPEPKVHDPAAST